MSSRKQKKSPTTEKAFSQEDFRGISQRLAREDHTHGTPANPSDAHVAGEDPHTQYRLESEDHSHEASGVPGGQLDHGNAMVAASLQDDDHPQYIKHSLATAVSDFLVASGAGVFVKKTLAEVKTILSLGTAAYTAATDYVTHALATAANDFLVASGSGVFVKKTLAEVKTILGLGSAAYTDSGDYAIAAKGVTNGDSHDHVGGDGAQIDHGGLGGLGDDDHTQYVLVDNSRMSTGEYRHVGDLADDATFNLPVVTNGGMGLMVAGADEERAQFSIKSDGTVNLIMASANVVANVDTDAKVCIGTSVASPCVIKNRLGGTKAILLQLWYN